MSEDVAAIFVRVARKSIEVPELELAVQAGLQISKAKTIVSVIDAQNKDQWIEMAQSLSKEKLEREVAAANPSAPKPERMKPTGPDRIRIEFEVTYEEAEILKRARELMSQKKSKNAQVGETVVVALRDWVERMDPVRKAERAQERKEKSLEKNRHVDELGQSEVNELSANGQEANEPSSQKGEPTLRHRSRDQCRSVKDLSW